MMQLIVADRLTPSSRGKTGPFPPRCCQLPGVDHSRPGPDQPARYQSCYAEKIEA